jgi:hypothetical protein
VGFNYFISEDTFQYILAAVHLLAEHAWKLLPLYRFDPASGLWRHQSAPPAPSLADLPIPRLTRAPERRLADQLERAQQVIRELETSAPRLAGPVPGLTPEFERIRWFPLPGEALQQLGA